MESLAEYFLRYDRLAVPAVVEDWVPGEQIDSALRLEAERNMRRTTDRETARAFMAACPVPGAGVDDYLHRVLDIDGGRVLAGIRFLGGDIQKPFVDILHRDFPIESPAHLGRIAREVTAQYGVFRPGRVRLTDNSGMLDTPDVPATVVCDFRWFAAPVRDLLQRPLPPRYDDVRLERQADLSFYDEYVAMYHRFYDDSPHLRGIVPIEPRDVLLKYMQEGVLCRIVVDGRCAGVVSAVPQSERFLAGWLIVEEILDREFRGRGLAPALQRRLLGELYDDGHALLYGCISPLNTASLRTAARVGRQDVGGMYFVGVGS